MSATSANLIHCSQCQRCLPRLLANEQRHFCDEHCAHEWSTSKLGRERPAGTYEVMNRLRKYLAAYIAGEGIDAAFVRLCIAAENIFRELNLKALMSSRDLKLAIYGEEETKVTSATVDPALQSPRTNDNKT